MGADAKIFIVIQLSAFELHEDLPKYTQWYALLSILGTINFVHHGKRSTRRQRLHVKSFFVLNVKSVKLRSNYASSEPNTSNLDRRQLHLVTSIKLHYNENY